MKMTPSDQKHFDREKQNLLEAISLFPSATFTHSVHPSTPAEVVFALLNKLSHDGYNLAPSDPKHPAGIIHYPADASKNIANPQRIFDFIEEIGKGAFGVIWKAKELRLDRFVAIKFLQSDANEICIEDQAKVLAKIDHENVVQVFHLAKIKYPESVTNENFGIVMPFLEGETLDKFLNNKGPEKITKELFLQLSMQLIEGIHAIHSKNIAHTDLHARNVMIIDNKIKIIDIFNRQSLTAYSNATQSLKFTDDVLEVHSLIKRILNYTEYSTDRIESIKNFLRNSKTLDELKSCLLTVEQFDETIEHFSAAKPLDALKHISTKPKRQRDIQTLEVLLVELPEGAILNHFSQAWLGLITDEILHFWDGFHARLDPSVFHMHDKDILNIIEKFHDLWSQFISKMENWSYPTTTGYAIDRKNPEFQNENRGKIIKNLALQAEQAYSSMINAIKDRYPEVDYREAYKKGWNIYQKNIQNNDIKWEGIEFEGEFFAWEGPFETLNEKSPRIIWPYEKQLKINNALKNGGVSPFYTNNPLGECLVYETDKRSWCRSLLGGGKDEKQTLAIKKLSSISTTVPPKKLISFEQISVIIDKISFGGWIRDRTIAQISLLVRNIGPYPAFSVSVENSFGNVFRAKRQDMASLDSLWIKNTVQTGAYISTFVSKVKLKYRDQEGNEFNVDYQIEIDSNGKPIRVDRLGG